MKNLLEYIPFYIISKIVQLIGLDHISGLSKFIRYLFYNLLKIRRDVVNKNLKIAFPEKTAEEIQEISKACYLHFSRFLLEIMCIPKLSYDKMLQLVRCSEIDKLKAEYAKGGGLIFLTAHIGNWEFGAISVPAQMGTIMYPIVKPQRNPYVTKWLNDMREKHGNKVIPLGISIRRIYEVIKKGNLLGVVGDQRGPKEGNRVVLFGRNTAIYSGTAEIVAKTKTPLYILFAVRENEAYRAYVEKINLDDLPQAQDEKVKLINQRYADLLEKYVRKYPDQWFWMHNIWKY